ncbi:MAG: DUF3006 domain-containing protein [Pyrinomonadaceae bacterium]
MTGKDDSPQRSATLELRAVIDRIEDGEIAVLSLDDETKSHIDVPRARLPQNARSDGDHLLVKFDVDQQSGARTLKSITAAPARRAAAEDRIKKMQERLERMSGTKDQKDFKL